MTYLEETNKFIKEKKISKEKRPYFHLTAPIGWINDPNGFSEYNNKKHLFYQYYPYNIKWGPMHWGHAQSDDLITWEELPIALAPGEDYDSFGCYSGTALTGPKGEHALFYTGVVERMSEDGQRQEIQTQCLATGDGITYQKFEGNPLLEGKDLPDGFNKIHFRDPKVWFDNNTYYMLVGNMDEEFNGQVLLFKSPDMYNWKFVSVFADSHKGKYGRMWECPDYFKLDNQDILIVSPQDMLAQGNSIYNGNHSLVLIGEVDEENNRFKENQIEMLDYGTEFYAAQTTQIKDGRRVMIAWMNSWDMLNADSIERNWTGMMTLPRELSIRNGKLFQVPIREIENYWSDHFKIEDFKLNGRISFPEIRGRAVDLSIKVKGDNYSEFSVIFAQNEDFYSKITYNRILNEIEFDRTFSGIRRDIVTKRKFKLKDRQDVLDMRIILDKFSIEAFLNEGRQTMTAAIYTPVEADGISFESDGVAEVEIESHKIKVNNFEEINE